MRVEIPTGVVSWMVNGAPVELRIGAHSIDTDWPWWRPVAPWEWHMEPSPITTHLIPIADACKAGCQHDKMTTALERIAVLVEHWQHETVPSSSIRRRYATMIRATALEALGRST